MKLIYIIYKMDKQDQELELIYSNLKKLNIFDAEFANYLIRCGSLNIIKKYELIVKKSYICYTKMQKGYI